MDYPISFENDDGCIICGGAVMSVVLDDADFDVDQRRMMDWRYIFRAIVWTPTGRAHLTAAHLTGIGCQVQRTAVGAPRLLLPIDATREWHEEDVDDRERWFRLPRRHLAPLLAVRVHAACLGLLGDRCDAASASPSRGGEAAPAEPSRVPGTAALAALELLMRVTFALNWDNTAGRPLRLNMRAAALARHHGTPPEAALARGAGGVRDLLTHLGLKGRGLGADGDDDDEYDDDAAAAAAATCCCSTAACHQPIYCRVCGLCHVPAVAAGDVTSDPFSRLPGTVIELVLSFLPTYSLPAARLASRAIAGVSTFPQLSADFWRSRFYLSSPMAISRSTRRPGSAGAVVIAGPKGDAWFDPRHRIVPREEGEEGAAQRVLDFADNTQAWIRCVLGQGTGDGWDDVGGIGRRIVERMEEEKRQGGGKYEAVGHYSPSAEASSSSSSSSSVAVLRPRPARNTRGAATRQEWRLLYMYVKSCRPGSMRGEGLHRFWRHPFDDGREDDDSDEDRGLAIGPAPVRPEVFKARGQLLKRRIFWQSLDQLMVVCKQWAWTMRAGGLLDADDDDDDVDVDDNDNKGSNDDSDDLPPHLSSPYSVVDMAPTSTTPALRGVPVRWERLACMRGVGKPVRVAHAKLTHSPAGLFDATLTKYDNWVAGGFDDPADDVTVASIAAEAQAILLLNAMYPAAAATNPPHNADANNGADANANSDSLDNGDNGTTHVFLPPRAVLQHGLFPGMHRPIRTVRLPWSAAMGLLSDHNPREGGRVLAAVGVSAARLCGRVCITGLRFEFVDVAAPWVAAVADRGGKGKGKNKAEVDKAVVVSHSLGHVRREDEHVVRLAADKSGRPSEELLAVQLAISDFAVVGLRFLVVDTTITPATPGRHKTPPADAIPPRRRRWTEYVGDFDSAPSRTRSRTYPADPGSPIGPFRPHQPPVRHVMSTLSRSSSSSSSSGSPAGPPFTFAASFDQFALVALALVELPGFAAATASSVRLSVSVSLSLSSLPLSLSSPPPSSPPRPPPSSRPGASVARALYPCLRSRAAAFAAWARDQERTASTDLAAIRARGLTYGFPPVLAHLALAAAAWVDDDAWAKPAVRSLARRAHRRLAVRAHRLRRDPAAAANARDPSPLLFFGLPDRPPPAPLLDGRPLDPAAAAAAAASRRPRNHHHHAAPLPRLLAPADVRFARAHPAPAQKWVDSPARRRSSSAPPTAAKFVRSPVTPTPTATTTRTTVQPAPPADPDRSRMSAAGSATEPTFAGATSQCYYGPLGQFNPVVSHRFGGPRGELLPFVSWVLIRAGGPKRTVAPASHIRTTAAAAATATTSTGRVVVQAIGVLARFPAADAAELERRREARAAIPQRADPGAGALGSWLARETRAAGRSADGLASSSSPAAAAAAMAAPTPLPASLAAAILADRGRGVLLRRRPAPLPLDGKAWPGETWLTDDWGFAADKCAARSHTLAFPVNGRCGERLVDVRESETHFENPGQIETNWGRLFRLPLRCHDTSLPGHWTGRTTLTVPAPARPAGAPAPRPIVGVNFQLALENDLRSPAVERLPADVADESALGTCAVPPHRCWLLAPHRCWNNNNNNNGGGSGGGVLRGPAFGPHQEFPNMVCQGQNALDAVLAEVPLLYEGSGEELDAALFGSVA